jgi:DNA-binding transcriptional LysR family regulator
VSPAYVEKFGLPAEPKDLGQHNCLLTNDASSSSKWRLLQDGEEQVIHVTGNLVVNDGGIYKQAIMDGIGIGHLSRYLVYKEIADGTLIELFPESRVINSYIYVVYPQRRNLPLKTRVFIDHLREAFRGPLEWMP